MLLRGCPSWRLCPSWLPLGRVRVDGVALRCSTPSLSSVVCCQCCTIISEACALRSLCCAGKPTKAGRTNASDAVARCLRDIGMLLVPYRTLALFTASRGRQLAGRLAPQLLSRRPSSAQPTHLKLIRKRCNRTTTPKAKKHTSPSTASIAAQRRRGHIDKKRWPPTPSTSSAT